MSSSTASLNPPPSPLRCFYNLEGDEFSGWYAITNPFSCNDFCFWRSNNTYNNYYTIDPHQSTLNVKTNASWYCAYNAALDNRRWNVVLVEAAIPYNHGTFDYLRCSRGPLEIISSSTQRVTQSQGLWISFVILAVVLVIIQITILINLIYRRRKSIFMSSMEEHINTQSSSSSSNSFSNSRSKSPRFLRRIVCIFGTSFIMTTLFLSISSIALYEQQSTYDFTHARLALLTPSCVSPRKVCLQGNQPIFHHQNMESNSNFTTPFSYMIASDAQLYWYDGEFPFRKTANTTNWLIPLPCTPQDSCSSCTKKVATYTNRQMKKAMEKLVTNTATDNNNNTPSLGWITPKTLIMNGDLTSYFHPSEKSSYESFYHTIEGLEQYFPSLGNHDYDHYEGASYHGDEWFSPHDCNAIHAIRYIKSAFCQDIPKFDALHRLTQYDNKSLAYSWDENKYHFVHLHYYPSYENARLGIASSLSWLESDLTLACERNRTSILFVHAVEGLPTMMKDILLNKNVKAIFSGHQHKCLGRKCNVLQPLSEWEVQQLMTLNISKSSNEYHEIHKCFPAGAPLCGGNADSHTMSLFYTGDDIKSNPLFRRTKLFAPDTPTDLLCPVSTSNTFVNHTDNTLLCRRIEISPSYFTLRDNSSIPIFWSGSVSFLTFLKVDFYLDRFIVHVHTAEVEDEGKLYLDVHNVPNIVYPYHRKDDLDSITIEL